MNQSTSAREAIARIDSEPPPADEYDAPTRVGPMSAGAVAKLMHEAEQQAKRPPSAVSPSSPSLLGSDDAGPPVLGFPEDSLEPTVVNNVLASSGFNAPNEAAKGQLTASLLDAIVDEIVTLDNAELEAVDAEDGRAPSKPPPLPARATNSVGPRRSAARPAAFPEWIPRAAEPAVANDRKRSGWIAAGGCVATLILVVWWLCA